MDGTIYSRAGLAALLTMRPLPYSSQTAIRAPSMGPPTSGQFYVPPLLYRPVSPLGVHSSPALFNEYADILQYAMKTNNVQDLLHYLHDYFTVGPPHSLVCANNIATMITMCEEIGFAVNSEKSQNQLQPQTS